MSYFISNEDQNKLNDKVKKLEIEGNIINDNLGKYYNDLKYLKKHIIFSFLTRYNLKLQNFICKEKVLKSTNRESIELIKVINSKLKDLVVVMYTKGNNKSILEEEVYYECMDLYNTLILDIQEICNSTDVSIIELSNLDMLIDKVYNYYKEVNFDDIEFDFNEKINIEDYKYYDENISFIEYICNCFKDKVKYEEFNINAKKYLTIRKCINNNSFKRIRKNK